MAIRPIRPDQQATVISTLETATDLSHELGPDAAIAKAAQQHGLPERFLPYTVNAYNTGKSLENIKSGGTREERAADVPLASLDGVMRHLYPDRPAVKSAVSRDYLAKPSELLAGPKRPVVKRAGLVKLASAAQEIPDDKILLTVRDLQQQVQQARSELNQEFHIYKRAQQNLQTYLDNQNHMRLGDLVEQSRTAFGDMAKIVLEPLQDNLELHKKSSWGYLIRVNREPFTLVKAAIDQLNRLHELGLKCGQIEQEFREGIKTAREAGSSEVILRSLEKTLGETQEPVRPPSPVNKKAFDVGQYLLGQVKNFPQEFGATHSVAQAVMPKPKAPAAKPDLKPEAKPVGPKVPGSVLDAPQHEEVNALQKSVAVNNLLASDPDLQGYDRDTVARAFNEIQMAYPRVASHPATLRPFIQRHLTAGGLDEFSLKNLADQEYRLAQIQNPGAKE